MNSKIPFISVEEANPKLNWHSIVSALEAGHRKTKPTLGDLFLTQADNTLLSRAAWVEQLGVGVKSVTVLPSNRQKNLPTIHGAMLLFDDQTGQLQAVLDSDLVTYWKTAADSVLGAKLLARPDSQHLLIIGAGVVAGSLVRAYSELFPNLQHITLYNRTPERATQLAKQLQQEGYEIAVNTDLAAAIADANIISTATLARQPILPSKWVKPGTHIDLIGAFTADMREADDDLMVRGCLFVDCIETTVDHIGELMIPLASGAIQHSDVLGDLYDLVEGRVGRQSEADITLFKNGGGAHLDVMTARAILAKVTLDNHAVH